MRAVCTIFGLLVLSFALLASSASAEVVTLRSGSAGGGPGAPDPLVTMLVASTADGPLPSPFAPSDFQAAIAGQNATITTTNSSWQPTLLADPLAQWINNDGVSGNGRSVLYALPIVLNVPFASATLDLDYMVDDHLGENVTVPSGNEVPGIYVNGAALPSTNGLGDFNAQHFFSAEIGGLLTQGVNYVFLYCYDQNVDAGIIFSARITTTEIPNATAATSWGAVKRLFR